MIIQIFLLFCSTRDLRTVSNHNEQDSENVELQWNFRFPQSRLELLDTIYLPTIVDLNLREQLRDMIKIIDKWLRRAKCVKNTVSKNICIIIYIISTSRDSDSVVLWMVSFDKM